MGAREMMRAAWHRLRGVDWVGVAMDAVLLFVGVAAIVVNMMMAIF